MYNNICKETDQAPSETDASLSLDSNRTTDTKIPEYDCCPTPVGYFEGVGTNANGESRAISGLMACKKWSCPYCGPRNLRKLKKRAYEGHIAQVKTKPGFRPNPFSVKMLTLTCPGAEWRSKTTPEHATRVMSKAWEKLRKALRKEFGHFEYLRVIEPQQDGFPHYHVMLNGDAIAPKRVLGFIRRLWRDHYGLGNIDIQTMRGGIKAGITYCLKYITKGMKPIVQGGKLYTASRNALLPRQRYWAWEHKRVLLGFGCGSGAEYRTIDIDLTIRDEYLRANWPLWDHFSDEFKESIRGESLRDRIAQGISMLNGGQVVS